VTKHAYFVTVIDGVFCMKRDKKTRNMFQSSRLTLVRLQAAIMLQALRWEIVGLEIKIFKEIAFQFCESATAYTRAPAIWCSSVTYSIDVEETRTASASYCRSDMQRCAVTQFYGCDADDDNDADDVCINYKQTFRERFCYQASDHGDEIKTQPACLPAWAAFLQDWRTTQIACFVLHHFKAELIRAASRL